jgi:hypothetical protein
MGRPLMSYLSERIIHHDRAAKELAKRLSPEEFGDSKYPVSE